MSKSKIDFTKIPGDYTYTQDKYGKSAYGVVAVGATSQRNNALQRTIGGRDRQPNDHGGHLIAHSLAGRNDESNLDPQNANINQITQRSIEREIANLANDPNKIVYIDVQNYSGSGSQRPDATMMTVAVQDKITGQIDIRDYSFQNASYQEQEEWDAIAREDVEVDPCQDIGMTPKERELANEYADEPFDIPLGQGRAFFLDPDSVPIPAETGNGMNDGVSLGIRSAESVTQDYDDGVSLGNQSPEMTSPGYDDGVSLGIQSNDSSHQSCDEGIFQNAGNSQDLDLSND